jgi:hypothetical protein
MAEAACVGPDAVPTQHVSGCKNKKALWNRALSLGGRFVGYLKANA